MFELHIISSAIFFPYIASGQSVFFPCQVLKSTSEVEAFLRTASSTEASVYDNIKFDKPFSIELKKCSRIFP